MEGAEGEGGSPSAASSHSLPARGEGAGTAGDADWITTLAAVAAAGSSEEIVNHTHTLSHTHDMGQHSQDHQSQGVLTQSATKESTTTSTTTAEDPHPGQDPPKATTSTKDHQREEECATSPQDQQGGGVPAQSGYNIQDHPNKEDTTITTQDHPNKEDTTITTQDHPNKEDTTITTQDHLNKEDTTTTTISRDHQSGGTPTPTLTLALPAPQEQHPAPPPSTKLCGYLQKQGGPLKAWKLRWFTYEEKKSQLFYYRTAQDVTSLGRVELCNATFTYPLKGEAGTFHVQTPERTYVLKAANQEARMYWLQQLQLKRWQHRDQLTGGSTRATTDPQGGGGTHTTTDPHRQDGPGNPAGYPDDFLPTVKTPPGLVGEEAATWPTPPQRSPLSNVSIKHPLIEIQNSVYSMWSKRSSQELSQSVFHLETPAPWTPPDPTETLSPTTGLERLTPKTPLTPVTPLLLAEPAGRRSLAEDRSPPSSCPSPSLSPSPSQKSRRKKRGSSATMPTIRREASSADRMSRLQQDKHMLAEEVKSQKELVWLLHKALEASQKEKRTCGEFLAAAGEQERLELLRHRERQVSDLHARLEEQRAEGEELKRSLDQSKAHVAELQENVSLMMGKNHAKQEVILRLSEQVAACLADPRRTVPSTNGMEALTFHQLQDETENLKDDIKAYKTQNKFLNSEIHQLTKLWRNSSEQEKSLMVKCAYLEASNCQKESRYLGVLRTLQENRALEPGQRHAVKKLIEEALQGEMKDTLKLNPIREHDEYGFKIIPDYEVEDMKLLAKIQALEIRSHNLLRQEAGDRPLLARWAQYLGGRPDQDLCPSPELKHLLRSGVPREYRPRVWRWVVRARTRSLRERHPDRYEQLCEKSRTSPHPASRQIQLDLHRTLTTNQRFSSPSSPAHQQLQRILLAFSWQNPTIGYCQGLNRLAAIALLVLESEEDAFWCLVAVVEAIIPQDYYTKTLIASQADQRVLKEFLGEKVPRLAAHLEQHNVDVSLITFNWFLVVFVESLPSDILLRVWDAFLYEGTKVIFRYALALFKYKEEDILKINDNVEIYQYLRFFTKTITDGRKLTNMAFVDMNPFPRRLLRNRRAVHLEHLQGELRELEAQQREFVTESAERKDKDLTDTMISEDDEEL